jgi:F5/8 type C domain-containing protein
VDPICRLCTSIIFFVLAAGMNDASATPIKARPIAVSASNALAGYPASNVSDGDISTAWNAGASSSQWIMLDLGRTVAAWKIRLLVRQDVPGATTHNVYAGQDQASLRLVTTFSGQTADGQWLEYSGDNLARGGTRYVRVETTASPSNVAWSEIEVQQGVEYFGPFASAFDGHGTGDYTAEVVAAGSNLTWIATGDLSTLTAKLQSAKNAGAKAVVFLSGFLFQSVGDNKSVARSDWQTQWANVAQVIKAAGQADTVAAFYPLDEPYTNAVTGTEAAMRDALTSMAAAIRSEFPTTPVAAILAYKEIQAGYGPSYVSMFDWVGFDCYGPWENCNGSPMSALISTLRSWLSPSQRMIAVPEAFRWDGPADLNVENILIDRMNRWHTEILSDGKYVAIAPFLWPSVNLGGDVAIDTGIRDLSWVRERVYQFATEMINPQPQVFPVSYWTTGVYGWHTPFAATNRNPYDDWNSGGFPWAYVVYELGGNTRITRIQLLTSQYPAGSTAHYIYIRTPSGAWTLLQPFIGYTVDNQWLTWTGSVDATAVEIFTDQSPSWVGWREIQINRTP